LFAPGGVASANCPTALRDAGQRPGLTSGERQRLKQLERENGELRRANDPEESPGVFRTSRARPPGEVSVALSRLFEKERNPLGPPARVQVAHPRQIHVAVVGTGLAADIIQLRLSSFG
jgi:hypothetical protein